MARNTLAFKGMETWVKQRSGLGYFSTNIKQSTVIEQATLKKLPLPEHAKKADVTASYRKIVEEFVAISSSFSMFAETGQQTLQVTISYSLYPSSTSWFKANQRRSPERIL